MRVQLEGAILLVDDVQLLSGKEHSLGELFNLFNWHQARGARLAFTSDCRRIRSVACPSGCARG